MSTSTVKGYLLTVLCGLVVFAAILLVILQWGVKSTFSLYGQPINDVPTIWLVLAAAVAGPIFLLCCRGLGKGVWILYTARRAEAKATKEIQTVVDQATANRPAADQPAASQAPTDQASTPPPPDQQQ